jgi:hypothetical protein
MRAHAPGDAHSAARGSEAAAPLTAALPADILRTQQQAVLHAMVDPGLPMPAALAPRVDGGAPLLGIYRHAYRARLSDALADNHPVLQRALGDEAFAALAQAYIAAHPPHAPSIRWFGDRLADFMRAQSALVPHPALVDLARMEWALREAFDAPDAPALAIGELAALPPEHWARLTLRPHPSLQWLTLDWAIEAAWRALRAWEPERGEPEPDTPAPEAQAHTLLVWRRQLETQWRSLPEEEAQWLHAALQGEPFGALCERAAAQRADDAEAATAVALALQQWLQDGLFTAWSA